MGEATNKNIKAEISRIVKEAGRDEKERSLIVDKVLKLFISKEISKEEFNVLLLVLNKEEKLRLKTELDKLHHKRFVLRIKKHFVNSRIAQLEERKKKRERIKNQIEGLELNLKKLSEFTVKEIILTPEILNAVTESELQQLIEANQDVLQITDNQLFLIKPDGEKELIKTYESQSRKPVKQLRLT